MLIQSINLTNFRNRADYHLDCEPDTTLILGPNGCGKTSVLEAIYILTRGKSFRATDPDIIMRDAPFYRISLSYDNATQITATYDGTTKTFQVEDKKTRRLPTKYRYPVVFFEPSDLNLISGSPASHRDYFDRLFSQFSDEYTKLLSHYTKAREQRNQLLKSDNCTDSNLFTWNLLLAKYGVALCECRTRFVSAINQTFNDTYYSIATNQDHLTLDYLSEVQNLTESDFLAHLEESKPKDLILGRTTFGVHTDDFRFTFNHQDAKGSASRGESRSIILALKFVEANLLERALHLKPIVLLDDVFSELDQARRKCLVNNFKNHQVIITSVEDITKDQL